MNRPTTHSNAETNGILVEVQSRYVADESAPMTRRFVFEYTITITNNGSEAVQLQSRHWPGVVGEQPVLSPGEGFRYTSGAVLPTERGTMHGTYQMHRSDGAQFDATIAPFSLERPHSLN
ncbi:MAG: Co2+/Mg2+ efflux protein ApaG [Deltaproteobacteria bacterium]|nr:Co2+/Mg2+ efflux protein ApaG [Deltaproteobacteria bacterium]